MHKMPYKHIAAHLKKTELACRLHYHQLSFGNKRHRRASSASPTSSAQSPTSPPRPMTDMHQQRQLPPLNPSPVDSSRSSPCSDNYPMSPQSHLPILPKPMLSPHQAGQQIKSLRLITEDIESLQEPKPINMARLNRIYNSHRAEFWSMIAQSYGSNVNPSALEEAWLRTESPSSRSIYPPTPCGSPDITKAHCSILSRSISPIAEQPSKGFTPVNSPQTSTRSATSSFAISSLLTEDKEVRSPSDRKPL